MLRFIKKTLPILLGLAILITAIPAYADVFNHPVAMDDFEELEWNIRDEISKEKRQTPASYTDSGSETEKPNLIVQKPVRLIDDAPETPAPTLAPTPAATPAPSQTEEPELPEISETAEPSEEPIPEQTPEPVEEPSPEPSQEPDKNIPLNESETLRYWLDNEKDKIALVGDPSIDVVSIARSQLGYHESAGRYTYVEGYGYKHYTRYGAFMERPYCTWCAAFVSFCVNYAGLTDYPTEISCIRYEVALKKAGYFREWNQYIPRPGDIIFLNLMNTGGVSHVGIVEYVEPGSYDNPPIIHTIEGNVNNSVMRCTRSFDDVIGYGTYTKVEIDDYRLTYRNDFETRLPDYESYYYCYPVPNKKIINYIKGTATEYYERLYAHLDEVEEVNEVPNEDYLPVPAFNPNC